MAEVDPGFRVVSREFSEELGGCLVIETSQAGAIVIGDEGVEVGIAFGMVERFNRRLGEHLDRVPQNRAAHHRRFRDHAERDAYLHTFLADYNHTRLRCLDYQAPAELLAKLAGHNTFAGVTHMC